MAGEFHRYRAYRERLELDLAAAVGELDRQHRTARKTLYRAAPSAEHPRVIYGGESPYSACPERNHNLSEHPTPWKPTVEGG